MHTGVFEILTIVLLYQIQTPLRRHLHDRRDLRSLRPCLETKRRRQRDGPRHRQRRTVEWTQFAGCRWQAAMAPLIGELSAKLTERLIGCFLGLRCGVAATDSSWQRRFGKPSARSGTPCSGRPLRYRIQAMEMNAVRRRPAPRATNHEPRTTNNLKGLVVVRQVLFDYNLLLT